MRDDKGPGVLNGEVVSERAKKYIWRTGSLFWRKPWRLVVLIQKVELKK